MTIKHIVMAGGAYNGIYTIGALKHLIEKEFFDNLGGLTFERAQEIINYLNENKIEMDLDKQFNSRFL